MTLTGQFLVRHGYLLLFGVVFAEQIGVPLPAIPFLLAAGALAGHGQLNLAAAILVTLAASLLGDVFWFELGRRRGGKVLNLLCRISLEPDSCVRRTENVFAKYGARALLFGKFIPGLSVAAPPLAAIFEMRFSRFLLFDALGALIWAGSAVGVGYVFSEQLELVAGQAERLGAWLVAVLAIAAVLYVLAKYIQRRRFLREIRIARISPEELKQKLDSGEDVVIVDLRQSLDFEADPSTIPGALHLSSEEFATRSAEIPRDREIVLYCT